MENSELPISIFLRKDYQPHFFDLSGGKFFDFYLDIKPCYPSDKDDRDLTLLVNESVFDIPYAFQEGLLELIDEETGAVVVWPTAGEPPAKKEKKFVTMSRKSSIPGRRGDRLRSIPFDIFKELKGIVQPGRQYRISLRDLDLNVKWCLFDPPTNLAELETLPPSDPSKVVAKTTTNKLFHAVRSIPSPPPVSITLSLSSDTVSYSGSPTTIRVEITNHGFQAITVKSSEEQPYISTNNANPAILASPAPNPVPHSGPSSLPPPPAPQS